jgi:transketolase N-terminal domain/subunit
MIPGEKVRELNKFAVEIRKTRSWRSRHWESAMSRLHVPYAELMACLYGDIMKVDPKNPAEGEGPLHHVEGARRPTMYAALA